MLGNKQAVATVAVRDLAAGRRFYEGTLGLTVEHVEGGEAISFRTGGTRLIVYRSEFAGSNRATAVNWSVGSELEAIVRGLREKGVAFERYDLPGLERQGDLHVAGPMKMAWFKDPDGNIHALMNQ
jgi:catechol 2,3-dioxygenase-like lactoylglutathione lyase family enzyme